MNQIKKEINFDINNNIHINIYQYKSFLRNLSVLAPLKIDNLHFLQ